MKYSELTTKTPQELRTMAEELRAKIGSMKFDLADRKLKKTSDMKVTRRQIARILTALSAKSR
jgi:ribosomal protein L29